MDITYVVCQRKFNYRVAGILLSNGKLLAMHNERLPYYALPGGRVQLGETAEQAIRREIQEDLQLTPAILRPLWLDQSFFTEDVDGMQYHELCLYFLMDSSSSDLAAKGDHFTLQEGNRTHRFEWLPIELLPDTYFYPEFLKTELFHLPNHLELRTEYE